MVALFTPDEWSVVRPALDPQRKESEESQRWQARPNVIFEEAGLALGMAQKRTVLVKLGRDVKLFSDAGGIHTVNLDNQYESRNLLRGKLRTAGCEPDMETGDHLHTAQAGDFLSCVAFTDVAAIHDAFRAEERTVPRRRETKKQAAERANGVEAVKVQHHSSAERDKQGDAGAAAAAHEKGSEIPRGYNPAHILLIREIQKVHEWL